MNIQTNLINQLTNKNIQPVTKEKQEQAVFGANTTFLPSVIATGQSQINSNIPIPYTKLGEIQIPGLENNASLFRLANGQRVVILPKKGPTQIKTTFNVGSLNETEDIRGISHYIEHNLFNGSKGLEPKEYDKKVSDLGGNTNASTGFATTDYYLSLQLIKDNSLEDAIKLNSMQTQFPTFPVEQLEKEKEPVKSEIDMYLDDANDVAVCNVLKNLFNVQTNSTNFIIGTKANINSFTRDKVLDYYNTWYTPDNAVTVITGDVNVDETINLVSKYYNKPNDYSKINQRHYEPIQYITKTTRNDIIMPNSMSAGIHMGFAIPENTSKEDLTKIDTLMTMLMSQNSRLSKALDKYGLSADFYSEKIQNKPNSAAAIMCSVSPNENQIEEVLKILYEEISYIANNPPSMDDLNNTKRKTAYTLNNMAEESESANSVLTKMVRNNDFNYLNDELVRLNSITPQDISDTARKFLDLNKAAICVTHSKEASSESIQSNYNKSVGSKYNVSFGSSSKIKESISTEMDKVPGFKLANNIETKFVPGSIYAKSALMLSLNTDELNDVSAPAFDILNTLLNRGNAFKNNDTFTQLEDSKDYSISFHCNENGIDVTAGFYTQDTNEVLSLMKETMMAPNFSQEEFDRAKEIIRESILSEDESSCGNLFSELFKDIKSFAPKEQRLMELEALTLADIQNLYARILNSSQAHATINAPIKEYPYLQDTYNYGLTQGLPTFKPVTTEKANGYNIYKPITTSKIVAKAEENTQAYITQAYTFKESENVDDIAKIDLLNIILGKGMSSRLFTDLREKEKLAYRVRSELDSEKDTGVMLLSISTTTESDDPKEGSPENAKKALEGFNRNVQLLKTTNVSQKELEDAKVKLKTEILNNFETSIDKTITTHVTSASPYGIRYIQEKIDAIDKVTIDDIRAAANYVFANQPVTSIVASQKTLDALNLK